MPHHSPLRLPAILELPLQRILDQIDNQRLPAELISSPAAIKVLACSRFISGYCQRSPTSFRQLLESGDLHREVSRDYYRSGLQTLLDPLKGANADDADLMRRLRQFRNREMVRIAWRDIAGLAGLEQTMEELSLLAEEMLDQTLNLLHDWLVDRFGRPENHAGIPQHMVIIAMGKLGAHELNFSSDIDLIFAFPEAGSTAGGTKSLENQEFFIRLGKQLIKAFNEVTADGFVFRVDMRLRPFGQSGALTLSFAAMEEYYVSHARDWERYAMIKANIAAGDKVAGAGLMRMLTPFVFRRYLDYGAYQAIREMKVMIDREVLRKGMENDIKLGAGGIREIEFIGQTFQLLRGGRVPALQARGILQVITTLHQMDILTGAIAEELKVAYCFLRNTEHRIQEIADQQTQALPTSDLDRARVSFGMGFENWDQFIRQLDQHRDNVAEQFALLLNTSDDDDGSKPGVDLAILWQSEMNTELALASLQQAGFVEPHEILQLINRFRDSHVLKNLSKQGQERLDRLMPLVLEEVAQITEPDQSRELSLHQKITLERVLTLIESVARRSVYLALLKEHPQALVRLVELCAASPWIAAYITRQPILLDELIDRETLFSPPQQAELKRLLTDQLMHLAADDLERQMDTLRHFRNSQILRVAAADITGHIPLAEVSNYLSAIAEEVLIAATELVWQEMVDRYGEPSYLEHDLAGRANFAIIAYGKLGGLELGYGSDLDVVFIHDSHGDQQVTNGKKQVDNSVFFNRLGQRLIHILTAMTPAGRTYEIDTRLRPSGMSGFLVSSLEAFTEYQQNKAWTWEHQALVRARPVAGDRALQDAFLKVRNAVLTRTRSETDLKQDVREMREKMREALVKHSSDMFDLKQGAGGMADIEFIVQYSVLRWASEHAELLEFTDNLRLLEILANLGLLKVEESNLLRDAYFAYRADGHRLALQELPAMVAATEYQAYRAGVEKIWKKLLVEN